MSSLDLNIQPLHQGQLEALGLVFNEKTDRTYILPGRGYGKSVLAIVIAAIQAFRKKKQRIMITYPSAKDADRVGKVKLKEILPENSYFWWESKNLAQIRSTGSQIMLVTRWTKGATRERPTGRGDTVHLLIHDEAAIDKNPSVIHNFNATVRGPGAMGVVYVTTPQIGWLKSECDKFGIGDCTWGIHRGTKVERDPVSGKQKVVKAAALYARTMDNPYGGEELHMTMLADLDSAKAAQELDGQWVALSGRLWDNWSDAKWPNGNIISYKFDRNQPWILGCDLGGNKSSWVAFQQMRIPGQLHPVHVITHEWQLNANQAPTDEAIKFIGSQMPTEPLMVCAGHDVTSRNTMTNSRTPQWFIKTHWPHAQVKGIFGPALQDPSVRHAQMRAWICSAENRRTLCIADSMMSYDEQGRGVKRVIEQDCWPDEYAAKNSFFVKDGVLEHCRDALHHYIAAHYQGRLERGGRLSV